MNAALSRRHASAFINAFLSLAAQAYLSNLPEVLPDTGHARVSSR